MMAGVKSVSHLVLGEWTNEGFGIGAAASQRSLRGLGPVGGV